MDSPGRGGRRASRDHRVTGTAGTSATAPSAAIAEQPGGSPSGGWRRPGRDFSVRGSSTASRCEQGKARLTRRRPDPPGAVDRLHAGAYDATVEAEGPLGAGLAGARPSDAPNLAALLDAAIF